VLAGTQHLFTEWLNTKLFHSLHIQLLRVISFSPPARKETAGETHFKYFIPGFSLLGQFLALLEAF